MATAEPTDGQLLGTFAAGGADSAFEELVRRHGRMVLGVCQRLLGDPHDAEDAFQATFLVLARSSRGLGHLHSAASWLHGVALRIALNARRRAARRRECERRAAEMKSSETQVSWRELGPALDEELRRLPERLRAPVLLCYVENKTTEAAAEELGWTHATLRGRLAKARELLRGRLARRGIVVGAAVLAAAMSEHAAAEEVPAGLVASVLSLVEAGPAAAGGTAGLAVSAEAASLAEELLRAMALARLWATGLLWASVAAVMLAGGLAAWGLSTDRATLEESRVPPALGGRPAPPHAPGQVPVARPPAAQAGTGAPPGPLPVLSGPAAGELDDAAARVLLERWPGAEVLSVRRGEEDGEPVLEVELALGGRRIDATVAADGELVEVGEELREADLPAPVLEAVRRAYPRGVVLRAEGETRRGGTIYEIGIRSDGRETELRLTPGGELVPDEEDAPQAPRPEGAEGAGRGLRRRGAADEAF